MQFCPLLDRDEPGHNRNVFLSRFSQWILVLWTILIKISFCAVEKFVRNPRWPPEIKNGHQNTKNWSSVGGNCSKITFFGLIWGFMVREIRFCGLEVISSLCKSKMAAKRGPLYYKLSYLLIEGYKHNSGIHSYVSMVYESISACIL